MKKILSIMLAILMLAAVLPFSVSALENMSGDTGSCTWSFDAESATLTVSGTAAMANYFDENAQPWAGIRKDIRHVVIEDGVTAVGDYAFWGLTELEELYLSEDLISIGYRSFYDTGIKEVTLPESLTYIGRFAFAGTKMSTVSIPDPNTEIGFYAFGFDKDINKVDDFVVYGKSGSTASTYSNTNGFTFIPTDSEAHSIFIDGGYAVNYFTGNFAETAYKGERIEIRIQKKLYENITDFYTYDDLEIENIEGKWYFIMPDYDVNIFSHKWYSEPLTIDFSESDSVDLSEEEYENLLNTIYYCRVIKDGEIAGYDLDSDGTIDTILSQSPDYHAEKSTEASVTASIGFQPQGALYSPITFVFAHNVIEETSLEITIPKAGDAYDYELDSAEVTLPDGAHYTVKRAKWFNEWGIAEDVFREGYRYIVELELVPDDGYAFTLTTEFDINGSVSQPYDMYNTGTVMVSSKPFLIQGDPHKITVNGGFATTDSQDMLGEHKITEAKVGDQVYIRFDTNDFAENEYAVQLTLQAFSEDVNVIQDAVPFFEMPAHDVTVELQYDKREQKDNVLDFTKADTYTAEADSPYGASEAYGIYFMLTENAKNRDLVFDDERYCYIISFDLDGDGSFDIRNDQGDHSFSLLPTCSLHPESGRIVYEREREESFTLPSRKLTIIFENTETSKWGDADSDGTVSILDATAIQKKLASLPVDSFNEKAARVDGKKLNVLHATYIQKWLAHIPVDYPIGEYMPAES